MAGYMDIRANALMLILYFTGIKKKTLQDY